jgi:transcriptional regulator with XRE-family HTH domain
MARRMTQQQVADAAGISRGFVAAIESRGANPTIDVVDRISRALELEAQLVLRPPLIIDAGRQRDLVHARCSGYVERRLRTAGWQTAREVEVVEARSHGWIDIMAFHAESETLLVVEIKTRLATSERSNASSVGTGGLQRRPRGGSGGVRVESSAGSWSLQAKRSSASLEPMRI